MKEPDIYKYVEKVTKKYGFKKHNFRIFYLNGIFELTISRGVQIDNTEFKFEFSNIEKQIQIYHQGGYISILKLDKNLNENILYSTFDAWLKSVFQLEELQPYIRSLKINKLKENVIIL